MDKPKCSVIGAGDVLRVDKEKIKFPFVLLRRIPALQIPKRVDMVFVHEITHVNYKTFS